MRALAALPLALLAAAHAGAAEIAAYDVRVVADAAGAGLAAAAVRVEGAVPGPLAIPVGFAAVTDLRLTEAPAGTTAEARPVNGQVVLQLALPEGVPASTTVAFEFAVAGVLQRPAPKPGESSAAMAGGKVFFRHALLCSQPEPIGSYRVELVLPAGLRAHAIREALPKLRPGEPGPRAQLDNVDGRPGARLKVTRLVQGETASVQLELVPASRSAVWLIAGLALSLLYLVRFRDLVARAT